VIEKEGRKKEDRRKEMQSHRERMEEAKIVRKEKWKENWEKGN